MISNGPLRHVEHRRENSNRRRATSFNHFARPPAPQYSASSGSSSSRIPEHNTSMRSLHERMAQLSLETKFKQPSSNDNGNNRPRPSMSQSRLPRRQLVRLSHKTQQQHQQQQQRAAIVDQTIPRTSKSETTTQRYQVGSRLEPPYRQNLHSIWVAEEEEEEEEEEEDTNNNDDDNHDNHQFDPSHHGQTESYLYQQLHETFEDILDDQQDRTIEQIIQRLRICLDERQARIDELEARHGGTTDDYKAEFESEKRTLLEKQRDQFETLKLKYRVGLEQIVDQWLSQEEAKQEQWMDQIQKEAEDRVARIEAQWKERNSILQQQLAQYESS
ncbi:predicted protein [Lichtheimia corymbifera JMRC:FSU:9682]|uniref:Uncharacterized protein n=1 Tax=Lichtheimia corymbifera JMRC:FSU:9682 TaxID=1263082 RepID=A0A068RTP8_9FUNG|nr:predicted protein [Lichtheimia corymbifera JMRC:FSU:9682]